MSSQTPSYRGYRFPCEIISHAVWLYYRFALSFRDVEDLLAQRSITVTYETMGPLVNGPVANVILGFVLRMDPRLHILIVCRRPYTGRGDQRALPGQGGTTVHQRLRVLPLRAPRARSVRFPGGDGR